jgi:predicted TIM-barrel fold metal-dependent hydrolase
MRNRFTRRQALLGAAGFGLDLAAAAAPVTIETHVHLFDPQRVPYAPGAPYQPPPYTLEDHVKLVNAAGLKHSIVVHPEPYQDDHRYLEYCFAHEPSPGYFKGTCLFDPFREDTAARLRVLMHQWPGRIVAMRIHEVKMTPESGSHIANRDMRDPRMLACWKALASVGLAVQMHCIPGQALNIRALARECPETVVILDHMGRPGQGTEKEFEDVLRLSESPRVVMKFSGWEYYKGDLGLLTKRLHGAFGAERMIWGTLGNTLDVYRLRALRFEELLAFATENDRNKIRGGNAERLFFRA